MPRQGGRLYKPSLSFQDPSGRYVVLYSYSAQDENDLSVERGQCVTVLNTDDPDWYWVRRYDQQEGFVPSGFIYPLDAIQRQRKCLNWKSFLKFAITLVDVLFIELMIHLSRLKQMYSQIIYLK